MKSIKFFTSVIVCLFSFSILQAQVFVIERGTNTSLTFDNLKAAVDALQDNDQLYIPPGVHSLAGYKWTGYDDTQNYSDILVVNKKVSIYGAGYNEGANSTVIDGGTFVIGKDADGSLITGIWFRHGFQLDNVSNCIVNRCKIDNNYSFGLTGTGNNSIVSECDINYIVTGGSSYTNPNIGSGLVATFDKCIFRSYSSSLNLNTATIYNSVFLSTNAYALQFISTSSLFNNIFIISTTVTNQALSAFGSNNTFSHNLWIGGYPSPTASDNNTFSNEIQREPYANVFVDPDNSDYHLKDGCSGKNAGSDGTDVGIYGTAFPFKESKTPSIPYFKLKVISPETDSNGKLPVNIQVEAQDR